MLKGQQGWPRIPLTTHFDQIAKKSLMISVHGDNCGWLVKMASLADIQVMKNNGISRLPWYQSQFAMKQAEIAGWVCTVADEKMKPWAWVPWEGYVQVLVGHSREVERKKMNEVVAEDYIY